MVKCHTESSVAPEKVILGSIPEREPDITEVTLDPSPRTTHPSPVTSPPLEVSSINNLGFKAGMTHILRDVDRPKSKLDKKEKIEAVTIIETPPLKVVGLVGYIETPRGLRALSTVWTQHLDQGTLRRFYKNWMNSKKKAFSNYKDEIAKNPKKMEAELKRISKYCTVVRVIAHTQMDLMKNLRQKKNNIFEIQINGGKNTAEKVAFAQQHFEKEVRVNQIFKQNELVDVIGVTKGKGFAGVMKRFGTRHLQKKSHRGYRKVGCIGAWHPSRVAWTVARAGQEGYFHRTEINKKIYRIGSAERGGAKNNATTDTDITEKNITPMGGFPHYGVVRDDFLMIKGCCVGPKKRFLLLRKSMLVPHTRKQLEEINLKFIDTSSKMGHGRFQTSDEKNTFYGRKKE